MTKYCLRFLSSNTYKIAEASKILEESDIAVIPCNHRIDELQTTDTLMLVKDKALKAFDILGKSLFVEHTGLYLHYMNGLPGGLTQIFWDSLQAERFSELFGNTSDPSAYARTVIGYIDGRIFKQFAGQIKGRIAEKPAGDPAFQWDCVFIPDGYDQTFAEMGAKKNDISMRRIALDKFASYLKGTNK